MYRDPAVVDAENRLIVQMRKERGLTQLQIAEELGVSRNQVRRALTAAGLTEERPPALDKSAVAHMYTVEKLTGEEIASRMGVSYGRVNWVLRGLGIMRGKDEYMKIASENGHVGVKLVGRKRSPEQIAATIAGRAKTVVATGICHTARGYILEFCLARQKWLPQQRLVWERHHGSIPDGMVIHHINHDGKDNRIGNLELMTRSAHTSYHLNVRWMMESYQPVLAEADPTFPTHPVAAQHQ